MTNPLQTFRDNSRSHTPNVICLTFEGLELGQYQLFMLVNKRIYFLRRFISYEKSQAFNEQKCQSKLFCKSSSYLIFIDYHYLQLNEIAFLYFMKCYLNFKAQSNVRSVKWPELS